MKKRDEGVERRGKGREREGRETCLGPATRKGSKASMVTIQGEMVVPKFYEERRRRGK